MAAIEDQLSREAIRIDEDMDPHLISYHTTLFLVAPAVFLLSIGLAFVNIFSPTLPGPNLALLSWIILALAEEVIGRILRSRRARK